MLNLRLTISAAVGGKQAANLESMSELWHQASMSSTPRMAVCMLKLWKRLMILPNLQNAVLELLLS